MSNALFISGNLNGTIGRPQPNGNINGKAFENRLSVMRVRSNFVAPYRKSPFFYIEKQHHKKLTDFKKHVRSVASSWPSGTYYLKLSSGMVFCRFDMKDGRVSRIYKDSPASGKDYPVWEWLRK